MVALGPVPAVPLLAALPGNGTGSWTMGLMVLPVVVAGLGAAGSHHLHPTARWDEGAIRGCVGGVLAGVAFAVLALIAGGSVGPGRMQRVSPYVFDVLVHGLASFGIGGLLGGVFMVWLERRAESPAGR